MTTTQAGLDDTVSELREGERTWASLSLEDRQSLLADLGDALQEHSQEWIDAAAEIKQLPADSPLVGEEWMSGPYALAAAVEALGKTMGSLAEGNSPLNGYRVEDAPGNRVAVKVLPADFYYTLLLNGFTAEVWSTPGTTANEMRRSAGLGQLTPHETNGIGVVLGAGNIFSIPPLDTLYELFAFNRVVLLKLNPITDPLLPVLEKIFAVFIERGLIRIITGGADIGADVVSHEGIDHVHITGSVHSHDNIVFGPGEEGRQRRERGEVLLDKPISSELGGVSPCIVVPGRWSEKDLEFQAENVVTQRLHNNGYNCIAAQVLVVSDDWDQKDEFIAAVRRAYAAAEPRSPYYPGSDARCELAVERHPGAERMGENGARVLLDGLASPGDATLAEEYFAPVFAINYLPGTGQEFVDNAVRFSNEELGGTLGANIVVHPDTAKELGEGFERAITELRYGTIAINAWTGVGYLTPRATWGAFPGHTLQDAQSGLGIVHNALLLDHTERTVVRGAFRPVPRSLANGEFALSPKPPWFVTNRMSAVIGRRLSAFAGAPGWLKLPGIFLAALRG
ncbi:MAG: aldehyde dehydrogenase family protein [Mycobacteriaceae bacterium]|uniref:aldehyde dehydrogenase family protein n=1 Tax=Corynebacterium sp. TaxID=1720 RepID=UPI003F9C49D0